MNIETCPHCQARVVPLADGTCPSCRYRVDRELTPEEQAERSAAREQLEGALQTQASSHEVFGGFLLLVGGGLVTLVSYSAAIDRDSPTAGFYIKAWGPALAGACLLIRGLVRQFFRR